MRVVLFDLISHGHHAQYVYFIAREMVECGDEVILVTSHSCSAWEPTRGLGKSVRIHYVREEETAVARYMARNRLLDLWWQFNSCLDLAHEERADAVLHFTLIVAFCLFAQACWANHILSRCSGCSFGHISLTSKTKKRVS